MLFSLVPLAAVLAAQPALAPSSPQDLASPLTFSSGVLSPPLAGPPAEAALRYALARRAELGLPPRATLSPGPLFSTRFGGSVHLIETVDGLEVKGGRVIVTFDAAMRVVRLSSSLKRFDAVELTPRLSGPEALAVAAREVEGALLKPDGAPYGGYRPLSFVVGRTLRAGYLTFVPTLSMSESWHLAVDGVTGEVWWAENKVHRSTEAAVYDSSPGGLSAGVGQTPTVSAVLPHVIPSNAGTLNGSLVRTLNCCPTANCDPSPGAPARRATGTFQTFFGTYAYNVAICDQRQRATNDPAVHGSGDYVYAPVDPPTTAFPTNTSPADFDEFAEVNAYHHVSRTYDLVRSFSYGPLSADGGFLPFKMRDFGSGKVPALWVNASEPSFGQRTDAGYVGNALYRVDNAMFVALESMAALSVPELRTDTDTLVMYQGDKADFAYDGPVVSHEFGHGIVYSTANWDTAVAIDSRSANNESSALHEAVADIFAAITNDDPVVGGYVGPRIDPTSFAIRSVDNAYSCPTVLWGESHQDSQHWSGAYWEARRGTFQGSDQGRTFDAAFFAALVSFPPDVNFEKAATIFSAQVGQAFPLVAGAEAKLKEIFTSRGVLGCSKVVDVTGLTAPREYYVMPGTAFANLNAGTVVPGPYQMKIRVPNGAKSVTISGPAFGGRFGRDGGTPTVSFRLLARANSPITFTRGAGGSTLTNDADVVVVPTFPTTTTMTATANLAVPCGGELYFTVANTSSRDRSLYNLAFSHEPADSCPPPPEPPPPPVEPQPVSVPLAPEELGKRPQGCGCSSAPAALLLPLFMPWLARRRRRGCPRRSGAVGHGEAESTGGRNRAGQGTVPGRDG